MIKHLIALMLISTPLYAGMGACHDGSGNLLGAETDANAERYLTTPNCIYYTLTHNGSPMPQEVKLGDVEFETLRNLIHQTPPKYLKWNNGVAEMSAAEKSSVDTAEALAAQAAIEEEEAAEPFLKDARDQADAAIADINAYLVNADTATNAQVRAEVKAAAIRDKKIIQALKRIIEREWRSAQ